MTYQPSSMINLSPSHSLNDLHQHHGIMQTNTGLKRATNLSKQSLCTYVGFIASGVTGISLIIIGVVLFPTTRVEFYAICIGGGGLVLLTLGGFGYFVYRKWKEHASENNDNLVSLRTIFNGERPAQARAIAFARTLLIEKRSTLTEVTVEKAFGNQMIKEPDNSEILMLKIISDDYLETLTTVFDTFSENPWHQKEVIKAADEYFMILYVIAQLSLKELQTMKETRKDSESSLAEIFLSTDYYYLNILRFFSGAYDTMRSAGDFSDNSSTEFSTIPQNYAELFYTKGSLQYQWRILFNTYCHQLTSIVSEEELMKVDTKIKPWIHPDSSSDYFAARSAN